MGDENMNLRVLKPSRKKLHVGDVFVMQLPDNCYSFGRVVSLDTEIVSMKGVILIYVYRERSDRKVPPDNEALSPNRLLMPPIMTNRLPWSRGYFETLVNRPLDDHDTLGVHCFRDFLTGRYFDEALNELSGPTEPVGEYGLHSYRTIDDKIGSALGLELAPD